MLAIPFNKGIGIGGMKKVAYNAKLNTILQLSKFERMNIIQKNVMIPALIVENRIVETLREMNKKGKIDQPLYKKITLVEVNHHSCMGWQRSIKVTSQSDLYFPCMDRRTMGLQNSWMNGWMRYLNVRSTRQPR